MNEESNAPISEKPKKNNTVLYIVIGVVVLVCICCVLLFVGQYYLENSNFSLVEIIRPGL